MNPLLQKFLAGLPLTGVPESQLKSLLDSCRSALLSVPHFQKQIQKVQFEIASTGPDHAAYNIARAEKQLEVRKSKTMIVSPTSKMFSKPTASKSTASKPAAATPAASKPAAPAKAPPSQPGQKLMTADEFATPVLKMTRPEFDKLTPADKMRFVKSGGKLV